MNADVVLACDCGGEQFDFWGSPRLFESRGVSMSGQAVRCAGCAAMWQVAVRREADRRMCFTFERVTAPSVTI